MTTTWKGTTSTDSVVAARVVTEASARRSSLALADTGWDVASTGQPYIDAEFAVTEGTWMSVDVSPDGSTLVFDLLGDIYRIPALEVMFRRLVNDAVRSDTKAMKLLLSLVDRYAETTEAKVQLGELLLSECHRELDVGRGYSVLIPGVRDVELLSPVNHDRRSRAGNPVEAIF